MVVKYCDIFENVEDIRYFLYIFHIFDTYPTSVINDIHVKISCNCCVILLLYLRYKYL